MDKSSALASKAAAVAVALLCTMSTASADQTGAGGNACKDLPGYAALKAALVAATAAETSGLNNQMWGTIVDRDGIVCAVAFSGSDRGAQWPGSRVISAQKANTANAFSLDSSSNSGGSGQPSGLALSTANLYSAVQPGGSLFGLQLSNPVNNNVHTMGLRRIRWSEARAPASTCSGEAWVYMRPARSWLVESG